MKIFIGILMSFFAVSGLAAADQALDWHYESIYLPEGNPFSDEIWADEKWTVDRSEMRRYNMSFLYHLDFGRVEGSVEELNFNPEHRSSYRSLVRGLLQTQRYMGQFAYELSRAAEGATTEFQLPERGQTFYGGLYRVEPWKENGFQLRVDRGLNWLGEDPTHSELRHRTLFSGETYLEASHFEPCNTDVLRATRAPSYQKTAYNCFVGEGLLYGRDLPEKAKDFSFRDRPRSMPVAVIAQVAPQSWASSEQRLAEAGRILQLTVRRLDEEGRPVPGPVWDVLTPDWSQSDLDEWIGDIESEVRKVIQRTESVVSRIPDTTLRAMRRFEREGRLSALDSRILRMLEGVEAGTYHDKLSRIFEEDIALVRDSYKDSFERDPLRYFEKASYDYYYILLLVYARLVRMDSLTYLAANEPLGRAENVVPADMSNFDALIIDLSGFYSNSQ